jgi:hypothetical protein
MISTVADTCASLECALENHMYARSAVRNGRGTGSVTPVWQVRTLLELPADSALAEGAPLKFVQTDGRGLMHCAHTGFLRLTPLQTQLCQRLQ